MNKSETMALALGIVAQAWSMESTSHKVMDVDLAEEFAKILVNYLPEETKEIELEMIE